MSLHWQQPPDRLALADEEVHVWLAQGTPAPDALARLTSALSADELARSFRTEELRQRWQATRGLLRRLLARYLGCDAREITFQSGPHGKPSLPSHPQFHFNLSHSGGDAAFAFTRAGEVGVDIEQARAGARRGEEIARRFFTEREHAELSAVPDGERARVFLELWTRKEAFVKARGGGVFSGLDQFEVSRREPGLQRVTDDDAARWRLLPLPDWQDGVGTVVVKSSAARAHFWQVQWDTL